MEPTEISHGLFLSIANSGKRFSKGAIPGASASALRLCDHFSQHCNDPEHSSFNVALLEEEGSGFRSNVIEIIIEFLESLPKGCGSFIIYIIAHGKYRNGLTILTEDTSKVALEETGIQLGWIYDKIAEHAFRKKLKCVLVLDCCIESFRTSFVERMPKCLELILSCSPPKPFASSTSSGGSVFCRSLVSLLERGPEALVIEGNGVSTMSVISEIASQTSLKPTHFSAAGQSLTFPIPRFTQNKSDSLQCRVSFFSREMNARNLSNLISSLYLPVSKVFRTYEMPKGIDEFHELIRANEGRIELHIPEKTPISIAFSLINSIALGSEDLFSEFEIHDLKKRGYPMQVGYECFGINIDPSEPTPCQIVREYGDSFASVWIDDSALRVSCFKERVVADRVARRPVGFRYIKASLIRSIDTMCEIVGDR